MTIVTQIDTCGKNYQMWKDRALFTNDISQARKALERAFFWLELKSAFVFLHTIEQTKGNDPETKQKLIRAKINLSKKLNEYSKEILREIETS
ncbi:MAG: hypothetical protein HYW24_00135 [Candidatus Aenigmarchaeota archaeon]|nr:hypothetical protein [Candidatus Aenigmarchaeota archaeon]